MDTKVETLLKHWGFPDLIKVFASKWRIYPIYV